MDYKEKYEKALERAKDMLSYKEVRREDMEYLFPELKESEDEKISKWLLNFVQGLPDEGLDFHFYNLNKEQVVVWLEKQWQSEQRNTWSEEDEQMYGELNHLIYSVSYCDSRKEFSDWLKSLKDRIQSKQGGQSLNIQWHDVTEEADGIREIFCEWETNDATWYDVAFYHADTKTFWNCERQIKDVVKWAYVDEMLEKSKQKEYTFKSLPRLLDMIEPTSKAKEYCQKLIVTLEKEGYFSDAKIVGEHLKIMNGEEVTMTTMDEIKGKY